MLSKKCNTTLPNRWTARGRNATRKWLHYSSLTCMALKLTELWYRGARNQKDWSVFVREQWDTTKQLREMAILSRQWLDNIYHRRKYIYHTRAKQIFLFFFGARVACPKKIFQSKLVFDEYSFHLCHMLTSIAYSYTNKALRYTREYISLLTTITEKNSAHAVDYNYCCDTWCTDDKFVDQALISARSRAWPNASRQELLIY